VIEADPPMRIGYNARLLAAPDLRGWNRYTVNLLEALIRLGVAPVLYSDRPLHPDHLARLPGAEVRVSPPMAYDRWEQLWFPRQARQDRVELLHSPFNYGLPWSSHCPRVLTLHDAIDRVYAPARPQGPPTLGMLRERLRHWSARARAHRVITVSDHARGDLVRRLGLPADRVVVIPEAADPRFHRPVADREREDVSRRHGLSDPYVFYVGGWERRKNIPFLVNAFAGAGLGRVDLVLAGGKDEQRDGLAGLGHSLGLDGRLRLIGRVADSDLPSLYAGALGFVYPSEYEGFGLQLCEAMALGRPVLASDATSLPEVLGDGGDTFPIDTPEVLAGQLRRLATDPAYRDDLSRRARARSLAFSWDRTAEATLAVYRDLVGA
jgi:glycosyltransferase involved in cell wall biosynthesis